MRHWMRALMGMAVLAASAQVLLAEAPQQPEGPTVDLAANVPRFLTTTASRRVPVDIAHTPILNRRLALHLRNVSLAEALQTIGDSTGLRFAYSRLEVPVDRRVQLEANDITTAAALTEVLLGTSVDVVFTDGGQAMLVKRSPPAPLPHVAAGTVSGTVTDSSSGEPLQGASVSLTGTRYGALANASGHYSFTAPPGRYQIRARLLGHVARLDSITVVDGQTTMHDFSLPRAVGTLNAVVVTGTRQPNRTAVDAPAPVDVFTAQEIRQSGRTETSQIIEMLAPSFNFPRPSVTDGTDHIRPATLRGLNSDQLLVLINGKRRHNSSLVNINGSVGRGSMAVDLNAIPPSAIDHIEILRDGAAAQYGSDAIAGVINIILKSDAPGELSVQTGKTNAGDGQSVVTDGSYSWALPRGGYLNLSGEMRNRDSTNRTGADTRQQYFTGDPRNNVGVLNNRIDSWVGDPKMNGGAGFYNLDIPMNSDVQFYSFGGMSYSRGLAAGFFRRAEDDRTLRAYYPNGFLPLIGSHIWDFSGAAGFKGTLSDWNWDLGSVFGRNTFRYDVDNSVNVSMGTNSPTTFNAGTMSFDQWTTTLDVQRSFNVGWAEPLSVAWGAEARRDHYGISAGDQASWINGGIPILDGPDSGNAAAAGAQVFPGFRPSDAQDVARTNVAGYVDLASNPVKQLMLDRGGARRALLRLRQHGDGQARRAMGADHALCAARVGEQRIPGAVA